MKWLLLIPGIIIVAVLVIVIQENRVVTTTQIQYESRSELPTTITQTTSSGGSNQNSKEKYVAIDNMRVSYGYYGKTTLYWEVMNGVGCCNTYDCDLQRFKEACINDFKLYDLYLDGVKIEVDKSTYEYECKNVMPYNYFEFNLNQGTHNLTIHQKECSDNIIDKETIIFEIQ